jgi:2-amino-4-hydroxy-6-hydroxymethyldihydropteridine diphosphokinase
MHTSYLLTGANLGNPLDTLQKANEILEEKVGEILQKSKIYRTAAWGKTDQPDFLNQVIKISTLLEPHKLMQTILDIELQMGRKREEKYGPRIIDIDILFYDDLVIDEPHLSIPHPRIRERRFVLEPLHEIEPNLVHPVFHQTIHQILMDCTDPLEVKLHQ